MADVFISYSRPDGDFVRRLHAALKDAGKDVWVDFEDIAPASPWARVVTEAIGRSDAFVFVISPDSVASPQCKTELDRADALKKRIVPLHLRETDPKSMPEPLSTHNWVPQIGLFDDDFETAFRTLTTAIETDLAWVREHTHWGEKAVEWEENDRDKSFLLSGAELRAAEAWLASAPGKEPPPTEAQGNLILESRRHATRRLRLTRAFVSAALVVSIVLLVLALIQRQSAIDNKNTAQSRELAAKAEANLGSDPSVSVALALQALGTQHTDQAEAALREALPRLHLRRIVKVGRPIFGVAWSGDGSSFVTADVRGRVSLWDTRTLKVRRTWAVHPSWQGSVALSPDGREVAVATSGKTASLLFLRGGRSVIRLPHPEAVNDVAFNNRGDEVVTASQDGRARIWDAADGKRIETLKRDGLGPLTAAAFSRDGREVATAGSDGSTRVWDTASGNVVRVVGRQSGAVADVAFSHDGKRILTAGVDPDARIRDVSKAGPPEVLSGQIGAVHTGAFSPNDSKVVTSSADGTAVVWDVTTGKELDVLSGDSGPVLAAAFDPSASGRVLTASYDKTARIWDAASEEARNTLRIGVTIVNSASFSPDGKEVVTASKDGKVRISDASGHERPTTIPVSARPVNTAEFSPDGGRILVASQDGEATIWSARTHRFLVRLDGDGEPVQDASFSRDGKLAVTASLGGAAIVCDAATGNRIDSFDVPGAVINSAAFSPNGKEVVTASTDGKARIWRVGQRQPIEILKGHVGPVLDAAFSPDGTMVVTGGADRTVRIWNASSGKESGEPLTGHAGPVYSVAFNRSGNKVLSASADGTARIWSVAGGRELTALGNLGIRLDGAAFSPDGRRAVTAGTNGEATIWSTELSGPLPRIERIARTRLARIGGGAAGG